MSKLLGVIQSYDSKRKGEHERGSIVVKINLLFSYGCHHKKLGYSEDKLPTCFDEDIDSGSINIIKEKGQSCMTFIKLCDQFSR